MRTIRLIEISIDLESSVSSALNGTDFSFDGFNFSRETGDG